MIINYISGWWLGTCSVFPFSWESHHPNWRTHIFQRGRYTTNQIYTVISSKEIIHNQLASAEVGLVPRSQLRRHVCVARGPKLHLTAASGFMDPNKVAIEMWGKCGETPNWRLVGRQYDYTWYFGVSASSRQTLQRWQTPTMSNHFNSSSPGTLQTSITPVGLWFLILNPLI